jgi:hypothetical protein
VIVAVRVVVIGSVMVMVVVIVMVVIVSAWICGLGRPFTIEALARPPSRTDAE